MLLCATAAVNDAESGKRVLFVINQMHDIETISTIFNKLQRYNKYSYYHDSGGTIDVRSWGTNFGGYAPDVMYVDNMIPHAVMLSKILPICGNVKFYYR